MSTPDPDLDPTMRLAAERAEANRAVEEAGGGESEGFELAEKDLIDHASHGDERGTTAITEDTIDEAELDPNVNASGEGDSERPQD